MGVMDVLSIALNLVLGGSLIVTVATLRATRQKSHAEAEKAAASARSDEIRNVEAAIKIWREMAETMAENHHKVSAQVEKLTKEVTRLTNINNKIVKLLDKITPENLHQTVAQIKDEINKQPSS